MIEQRKEVVIDKWRRRVQEEKIQKWATLMDNIQFKFMQLLYHSQPTDLSSYRYLWISTQTVHLDLC